MSPIHHELLSDAVRMEAYREAIFRTVRPGHVVLDLGAGTAILSIFACQAGASRVYAIEAEETILSVAVSLAYLNVPDGRIRITNGLSTKVQLPERVDVIVSEILGSLALNEGILPFFSDARERFLKPDGLLIPARVRLFLAPVTLPDFYRSMVQWWGEAPHGVLLTPLKEMAINSYHVVAFGPEALLAPGMVVADLDLYQAGGDRWTGSVTFDVTTVGTLHGIGCWFEATMAEGIILSTAPDRQPTHWQQAFFPIGAPVEVTPGCRVQVDLWATFFGASNTWSWSVAVGRSVGQPRTLASFTHSTALGLRLDTARFSRDRADPAPRESS